ncbi:MAG: flagellar protein [Bacteroidetes bacterium]|nr:flagellar protein [Bacteroidota bacterium]MBU1115147.1 flagellar protein [Bacteroidota bacterium]MBU1799318.1 flagellar protein [Bacteroidota bacterium]
MAMINGISVPFIPLVKESGFQQANNQGVKSHFDEIFSREISKVKLSKHAMQRLESRDIVLSENEMDKINDAVQKAEAKGSKDSLVMMNNTAFLVNIPNKTVITAMSLLNANENVFTNIDSVVFA